MAEIIDIFDANLRHLGTMDRVEAHRKGEWHQTFHCWIVNLAIEYGAVLFQLRSSTIANFPNLLDVSAAGHLEAGEKVEEGIREVSEELGIPVKISQLHPLGCRVEVADQTNGQRNREYQSVYLFHLDQPLSEYKPDPGEVTGLFWLPIETGLKLFASALPAVEISGIHYDQRSGRWLNESRIVKMSDFVPRIQQYYLTVLIMSERLRDGRVPLGIS